LSTGFAKQYGDRQKSKEKTDDGRAGSKAPPFLSMEGVNENNMLRH
jgi:hypothetical protein